MAKAGSSTVPVLAVVLLAVVLAAASAPRAGALTCGQVDSSLAQCIPYTQGKVMMVPAGCCSGVKSLNSAAKTTADRQMVCNCLKSAFRTIGGINAGLASGIPGKCGVSVPYPISPSVDCSTVK